MREILYFFICLIILSCGKVDHEVNPKPFKLEVPEDYTFTYYFSFSKIQKELLSMCEQSYGKEDYKYRECAEDVKNTLLYLIRTYGIPKPSETL